VAHAEQTQRKPYPVDALIMRICEVSGEAVITAAVGEDEKHNIALHALKELVELLSSMYIDPSLRGFCAGEAEQHVRLNTHMDHDGILAELAGDLPNIISRIMSDLYTQQTLGFFI